LGSASGICGCPAIPTVNDKPQIIDEAPQFGPERLAASWTARPKPGILAALPKCPDRAAVAQWIEYWPPKPRVAGSIPASRASFFRKTSALRAPWRDLECRAIETLWLTACLLLDQRRASGFYLSIALLFRSNHVAEVFAVSSVMTRHDWRLDPAVLLFLQGFVPARINLKRKGWAVSLVSTSISTASAL
jgi:hypothetical protein